MDEVVTHAEVLRWLPAGVARELELALPPGLRGWWTASEAAVYDGNLVEITRLCDPEPRFIKGR